jgi:hypothetical protein
MSDVPETMQYDVNLPKPRTRKVLAGILIAVLTLVIIGAAAAAIATRTAQEQADPTTRVMPANTILYFALNTHTEKLPNFNVIADAWKDSKEAKQVAAALELAFTQAGLNWEEDVQPWLGDRAALGLIDFGGRDENDQQLFRYRTPFFVAAVQTKDRAKSDAVLANLRKELESKIKPSDFFTNTIGDETYRGIPLVYMTTEYGMFRGEKSQPSDTLAYATVDDVIVFTTGRTQLQQVINAALDGQNLATSTNYKAVMSTLPGQNAGAFYMDFAAYMSEYFKMFTATSRSTEAVFDNIYTNVYSNTNATPDPNFLKKQEELKRQREEARSRQEQQLQQMHDMLQVMGGMGMVMTYEPTGIRFDLAMQYDPAKAPEKWAKYMTMSQTPASNRIFDSLPASTIAVMNGNMQAASSMLLDPDYWAMSLSSIPGMSKDEIANKLAEFQKLTGVDLKVDFLDLLNGEAAFTMLPMAAQTRSEFGFSMPFQFAALFDSNDAAKAASSLDKIVQAVSALAGKDSVKLQSLSGLPYSVVLDPDGRPMLTYGVVDGRLVIGTDSDTLLAIDNADQAPLSNDALFKQATGLLPGNRLNTFFMNFQPLWDLVDARTQGDVPASVGAVINYLDHFKWMSSGSEPPANGLQRGSLHVGISK